VKENNQFRQRGEYSRPQFIAPGRAVTGALWSRDPQGALYRGLLRLAITGGLGLLLGLLLLGVLSWCGEGNVAIAQDAPLFVEFEIPVPDSLPTDIAVDAEGRVWFTMRAANQIGCLVVTSTVDYAFYTYTVPTSGSEPYGIGVDSSGAIWFTEWAGNKIGRLVVTSTTEYTFTEFTVPTTDSHPAKLDIAPNGEVWFTENRGNKLARLVFTSTTDYRFDEYEIPTANGEPLGVAFNEQASIPGADYEVWCTLPRAKQIGALYFYGLTGTHFITLSEIGMGMDFLTLQYPYDMDVGPDGTPWLVDRDLNKFAYIYIGTPGNGRWFSLPISPSQPTGIFVDVRKVVWLVEKGVDRLGRLRPGETKVTEFALPSGREPADLAADSTGNIWVLEQGVNRIGMWRPPYFHQVFLPVVLKHFG